MVRFVCLFGEHRAYAGQEPARRYAALPDEWHSPPYLEEAARAVFALHIEVRRGDAVRVEVRSEILDELLFLASVKSREEPFHDGKRVFVVSARVAHSALIGVTVIFFMMNVPNHGKPYSKPNKSLSSQA